MAKGWGGKRPGAGSGGARPGAGRPQIRFVFSSDHYVIERGRVDELPGPPETWELAQVADGYFELQRKAEGATEVMTISKIEYYNGD